MNNGNPASNTHFQLTVDGDIAIITPSGQVFMQVEARELRNLIEHCRMQNLITLIMDISGCDYISSEGLGIFAELWRLCHDEKKLKLAIVLSQKPDNEVTNLFEITGLARVIGSAIRPNVADAIKYIKAFG